MKTPLEIFLQNDLMSINKFCESFKIPESIVKDDMNYIESAYNNRGREVIKIKNIKTMKYILFWLQNYLIPELQYNSKEYFMFFQLVEELKSQIDEVVKLENKVFSKNKRGFQIW